MVPFSEYFVDIFQKNKMKYGHGINHILFCAKMREEYTWLTLAA